MNRAVFFDRDGTLVRAIPEGKTTRGPRTERELEILPGVTQACQRLREAGYALFVITNQPDIARGKTTYQDQFLINNELAATLQIRKVYQCPHDGDWCACRKPKPGLIWKAAVEYGLDLSRCYMVGDRLSDHKAGVDAGCYPLLIYTNQEVTEVTAWILDHSK